MPEDLIDILGFPSVNIVLGRRHYGKTSFAGKVLEDAYKHDMNTYWVGLPESKWNLLPDWIKPVKNIDNLPDKSAIAFDEAYIYLLAREHPKAFNRFISKVIGVSFHKRWMPIFCTHTLRKLDVGGAAEPDNIVIRRPSRFYARFERPEVREFINETYKWFKKHFKNNLEESKKYALIYSEDYDELRAIQVSLPSFWSEELSNAFSEVSLKEMDGMIEMEEKGEERGEEREVEVSIVDTLVELLEEKGVITPKEWESKVREKIA